ncbi:MAG: hypothetical protein FJ098_05570 [Deltaproteobacteria bacterium]|nr:hypothetical protein [Deltaproteobacteria bacterium]
MRTAVLAFILLTTAAPVQAKWTMQHSIWGNGNTLGGIAAGSGLVAAAAGAISDGQGGSKAAVFWTGDGGQTWNETAPGGQFAFIIFLDLAGEKVGYGGGLGFFKTANGGQSWSSVTLPGAGMMTTVSAVQMLDPAKVFVGMENKVVRTLNTLDWQAADTGVDFGIRDLHFIDQDRGWVVGGETETIEDPDGWEEPTTIVHPKGTILRTIDGGVSFAPLVIGKEEVFTGVVFVSQNIGIVVGYDKDSRYFVRRTTDGGDTWSDVELPAHPSGQDLVFLSAPDMINMGQGWIVGGAGTDGGGMGNTPVFLRTWDGGLSWEHDTDYDGGGGTLMSVSFHDEHRGWACGDGGLIVAYNDGTPYVPPEPGEDAGTAPGEDAAGPDPDVWTWGKVLGSFDDQGNVGEGSGPGPDPSGDGGAIAADGAAVPGPRCAQVTETTGGCTAAPRGSPGTGIMVLLLVCAVALRRHRRVLLALVLAPAAISCAGESSTRTVCEDAGGVPWEEIAALPDLGDPGRKPEGWACTLAAEDEAPGIPQTGARTAGTGGAIVFVREGVDGGSDLWVLSPDGSEDRLTWFDDPSVSVRDPSWSADRGFVAFVSDYRAAMTPNRWNVFVTAVDRSACWQLTPDAASARILPQSALDATVTGHFQISVVGIGAALEGATVGFPGAAEPSVTGAGGAFSLQVPSGEGQLVFEGWKEGQLYRAVLAYQVEAGSTSDLGAVAAQEQVPGIGLSRPVWAADSSRLLVMRHEVADSLWEVPVEDGTWEAWLAPEAWEPRWVSPFPDGSLLALVQSDATHEILFVGWDDPGDPVHRAVTGELDSGRGGAVSPLRFLAVVMEGRPHLVGADPAGELTHHPVGPEALSILADQLDWSPDNRELVGVVESAGGTNLVAIDANEGSLRTLTTDGRSSMPAWFGR